MDIFLSYTLIFVASFCQVFFLGFNSKVLRDDRILAGACISWLITISQYGVTWAVVHAGLGSLEFVVVAGAGGSLGITSAQYAYKWYDMRFTHKRAS